MGKRELLIIGAFLLIGAAAYQLTAPPPKEDGFSFSGLMKDIQREVHGDPGSAEFTHTGTIPVSADLTELRISDVTQGIDVKGEDRDDIAFELDVHSTGPDDALALEYAKAVAIDQDNLGFALGLRVTYPPEASQTSSLTLRVPSRLAVVATGRPVNLANLARVELDGVRGDSVIENVAGPVTGSHRSGHLEINGAGSVKLTLTSTDAQFERVAGAVTVEARNGECVVNQPGGPVFIDQTNVDVTILAAKDTVRVDGTNGSVRLVDPGDEVRIDTSRTEVEIELTRGVPMTAITSSDTLRLVLAESANVSVDAVATAGGDIQATEFDLEAEVDGDSSSLSHTFGTGDGPRVALRNTRGDIVIRRAR